MMVVRVCVCVSVLVQVLLVLLMLMVVLVLVQLVVAERALVVRMELGGDQLAMLRAALRLQVVLERVCVGASGSSSVGACLVGWGRVEVIVMVMSVVAIGQVLLVGQLLARVHCAHQIGCGCGGCCCSGSRSVSLLGAGLLGGAPLAPLGAPVLEPHLHLRLGHGQLVGELGALRPGQILGLLEGLLEHVDLVAREGGPGVFLALARVCVLLLLILLLRLLLAQLAPLQRLARRGLLLLLLLLLS